MLLISHSVGFSLSKQRESLLPAWRMEPKVKKALLCDIMRSLPLGVVDSLISTFGVLILVRAFQADQWAKALVVASSPIGLLLSVLIVQIVRRSGLRVEQAICSLHLCAALGFSVVLCLQSDAWVYTLGVFLGVGCTANTGPLMSQIYQEQFPKEKRGQLYAYGRLSRKITSIIAVLLGGWFLKGDIMNYRYLFGAFTVASVFMAFLSLRFAPTVLKQKNKPHLLSAFSHIKQDKAFKEMLISWMFLGVGNLLCMALFVEYISNQKYGYNLDEFQVGLLSTFLPETIFVCLVVWMGKLFDRWNFYLLRVLINTVFTVGILIYFLGDGVPFLITGIAIYAVGKAAGNVVWSLWPTKFATSDNVAEYTSVHSFLAGIRGVASPFVALPLALIISPQWIAIISATLITIASLIILPKVKLSAHS